MTSAKQQNSFPLRMPAELRERLEARAKENGRSANSEIVALLSDLLDVPPTALSRVPAGTLLDEIVTRYGARVQIVVSPEVAAAAGISSTD
jgi:hypothetical protein